MVNRKGGLRSMIIGSAMVLLAGCGSSHKQDTVASPSNGGLTTPQSAETFGLADASSIQMDSSGKVINSLTAPANQTYYFSFDNSSITPHDMKALMIQADYLVANPSIKVRLEGNADARGSREYNIGLGWRRDQTVARILEQQGVKPNQIDMVSYGKEKPAIVGDNEQAWSLNRRVELVYENLS